MVFPGTLTKCAICLRGAGFNRLIAHAADPVDFSLQNFACFTDYSETETAQLLCMSALGLRRN